MRDADLPLHGHERLAERWTLLSASLALGPSLLTDVRALTGEWWGQRVRITDLATGRSAVYLVSDTGTPQLEVDLGDQAWLEFGYPAEDGIFQARLEVMR